MDARLPQPLDCSNLAKEWPMWKQQFFIYMLANNKNNEPEPNKIATLLWLIGKRGMEIYNSLFPYNGNLENMFDVATATIAASTSTAGGNVNVSVNAGSATTTNNTADANAVGNNSAAVTDRIDNYGVQRTLAQVITAFDEYCLPRKNLAVEAFKFNMIVQREKQSFSEFETELRTQLQYCEFSCASCHSSYADRILRDHIIVGIQDKKLQLRLLDGNDEPLSKIIQICKTFETAAENKQLLDTKTLKTEVNTVDAKSAEDSKSGDEVAVIRAATCFNCGQQFNERHRRNCPANNVSCHSCGRRGHFAKFCKSKQNDVKGKKSADGKRPENNNSRQNTVYRVNYSDLE
ncbi:uncharacterized protein LOC124420076 [Lucilia cuprina]|uniref:uncharacterized protein LOC124420076 n=1 Tax=Lucilia cuprina TaxID=7375 RepID=UPI001F056CC6|nr:uncharacterized protein LOC124420076 [Lucilia cuprina]